MTVLAQLQGFKAHRARINFDHDPVTLGELFDKLEKLWAGLVAARWRKSWVAIRTVGHLPLWNAL